MRRAAALCLWFLFSAPAILSQTAVVIRNVNLRLDPSTDQASILKLVPPAQVTLLEPDPTNGFYHVKSGDSEGWVWGKNIRIQAEGPPTSPTGTTSSDGALLEESPVTSILSTWDKGSPQNTVFHGTEGDCAETGNGGDTDTNKLKNRVDMPAAYHYVTWSAINSTVYPQGAKKSRADWTRDSA